MEIVTSKGMQKILSAEMPWVGKSKLPVQIQNKET